MARKTPTLIIIGGKEDRTGEKVVLTEVANRIGKGKLVVTTVATDEAEDVFAEYRTAFHDLGVKEVVHLCVDERVQAKEEERVALLDRANGVFFTGGDQLRVTSQIGDTPTFERIKQIYRDGGVIAGTSAGAAIMSDTMIVSGNGDESPKANGVRLAHGLAFLSEVIVDQHFAERGRIGRLLGVVAQNPLCLCLGIDEDTGIIVENNQRFFVVGKGSVYVVDGREVITSNVTEAEDDAQLSVFGVKLHLLAPGEGFDLNQRMPIPKGRKRPVHDTVPA
jgi:cyanophycinase